jgi:hypothetical protein
MVWNMMAVITNKSLAGQLGEISLWGHLESDEITVQRLLDSIFQSLQKDAHYVVWLSLLHTAC